MRGARQSTRSGIGAQFLNHSNPDCRSSGHPSATSRGMSTTATSHSGIEVGTARGDAPEEALVPLPQGAQSTVTSPANPLAMRLPVELEVTIPVRDFRVRNLLALHSGSLVESQWVHGEDVPLGSADVQLAWTEFDVVDTQLAVRLTRLV
jgi:flagellar motor switch/type III secretory pathway protein FliN